MTHTRKILMLACAVGLVFSSCQKSANEAIATDGVSDAAKAQIKALGFSAQGAQKVAGGYLVEGDILLSEAELNAGLPSSPNMIIASEEHYRTFNMVSPSKHPVIKVALNNSSAQHDLAFSAALDEAIARYNAQGLSISFQRVSTGADITVVAYYENSSTLGSAGFPNSTGDPYSQIKMNTYHYSTSTGTTNVNYIGTIIAHEMGHCIGFRHTDYMNRRYSCGYGGNEGQSSTGVGAVHIPGTPTKADANSWMLACVGSNVNRPFTANDVIALGYVY